MRPPRPLSVDARIEREEASSSGHLRPRKSAVLVGSGGVSLLSCAAIFSCRDESVVLSAHLVWKSTEWWALNVLAVMDNASSALLFKHQESKAVRGIAELRPGCAA